jgi:hypothetical protein
LQHFQCFDEGRLSDIAAVAGKMRRSTRLAPSRVATPT